MCKEDLKMNKLTRNILTYVSIGLIGVAAILFWLPLYALGGVMAGILVSLIFAELFFLGAIAMLILSLVLSEKFRLGASPLVLAGAVLYLGTIGAVGIGWAISGFLALLAFLLIVSIRVVKKIVCDMKKQKEEKALEEPAPKEEKAEEVKE